MDVVTYKYLAIALTMIGASFGAGFGISKVFNSWLDAIARNPSADEKLKLPGFVGFAGTELVLLLGFVVSLLLIFAA